MKVSLNDTTTKITKNGVDIYTFGDSDDYDCFVMIDNEFITKHNIKYANDNKPYLDNKDTNVKNMGVRLLSKLAELEKTEKPNEKITAYFGDTTIYNNTIKGVLHSPNYKKYITFDKNIKGQLYSAIIDFYLHDTETPVDKRGELVVNESEFLGNKIIRKPGWSNAFTLTPDGIITIMRKGVKYKYIVNTMRDDKHIFEKENDAVAFHIKNLYSNPNNFSLVKGIFDAVAYEKLTGEHIDGVINAVMCRTNAFNRTNNNIKGETTNDSAYFNLLSFTVQSHSAIIDEVSKYIDDAVKRANDDSVSKFNLSFDTLGQSMYEKLDIEIEKQNKKSKIKDKERFVL